MDPVLGLTLAAVVVPVFLIAERVLYAVINARNQAQVNNMMMRPYQAPVERMPSEPMPDTWEEPNMTTLGISARPKRKEGQ
jgi:hypothetical protein